VGDPELLEKLFSVVKGATIHPTLAGYFSKVFLSLLKTSAEAVLKAFSDMQLSGDFLRHLYSRSITDALCKVVALEGCASPLYVPMRGEIVLQVAKSIDHTQSHETVNNAAYLLIELISGSKTVNSWMELIEVLSQWELLEKLSGELACSEVHVIKSVVSVLEALCKASEHDSTLMQDEEVLVELLVSRAKDLSAILKRPCSVRTSTFKATLPTLGEGRLKLIEFVTAILRIDNAALNEAIAESDLIEVITGLFQELKWNSLLHCAYEQLVQVIVQSNSIELKSSLIVKAGLPSLLASLVETEEKYGNGVSMKTGQAGHVTRIANILVNAGQTYLQSMLEGNARWQSFIEGVLTTQNEIESRTLGGKKGNSSFRSMTSEEDELFDDKSDVTSKQRFTSWRYIAQPNDDQVEVE
jgi:hypothetical protein